MGGRGFGPIAPNPFIGGFTRRDTVAGKGTGVSALGLGPAEGQKRTGRRTLSRAIVGSTALVVLVGTGTFSGIGPAGATGAPSPVRNLVASVSGDTATISWQAPVSGTVARYKIDGHRKDYYTDPWPDFGTRFVGGSTTSITWDRLPINAPVYFVVTPIGPDGPNNVSGAAGPFNSTGVVTGTNSYCPQNAQADCLVVNTTSSLGVETRPGAGLLHGTVATNNPWVGALNLTHWRIQANNPTQYSEVTAVVPPANVIEILSDAWYGQTFSSSCNCVADPWANWATYDNFITQVVQSAESAGRDPYWEIQNEPENYPYSSSQPPTRALVEQQYLHAYTDIKAVKSTARVIGPSIDWMYENPAWPIDMKTFVPFAAANNMQFAALVWHENTETTDQNPLTYTESPEVIRDETETVRELIAESPGIGSPKLFVDENSSASGQFIPGFAASYFAEEDRAAVDEANRSCWTYPTGGTTNDCFNANLGQLLNSDGNPNPSYWTMVDYGTMNGSRVTSESTDNDVSSLAVTDSSGTTRILLGRHQTCSKATTSGYCSGPLAPPAGVSTTVKVLVPTGATSATVGTQGILNGTSDTLVAPATVSSTVSVTSGVASIPVPSLGDGDAYFLTVTPNSTAGASPASGDQSNPEVPPASGSPAATRMLPVSGHDQSATILMPFSQPMVALATDQYGNPMVNTQVTFNLVSGDGTFAGGSTTAVKVTDSNGIATSPTITAGLNTGTWTANALFTGISDSGSMIAYYSFTNNL